MIDDRSLVIPIRRPTSVVRDINFQTARLLHAGPAVVSRVKREMMSTAPMEKQLYLKGAALSDPFARRSRGQENLGFEPPAG